MFSSHLSGAVCAAVWRLATDNLVIYEGFIGNTNLCFIHHHFCLRWFSTHNFQQKLVLPLKGGKLFVRSSASVTIDTLTHAFRDCSKVLRNCHYACLILRNWSFPIYSCNINCSRPSLLSYTFPPKKKRIIEEIHSYN